MMIRHPQAIACTLVAERGYRSARRMVHERFNYSCCRKLDRKDQPGNGSGAGSGKAVRQDTLTGFQCPSSSSGHAVKAQSWRDAADVLKDILYDFHRALLVLGRECLRCSGVRAMERDGQHIKWDPLHRLAYAGNKATNTIALSASFCVFGSPYASSFKRLSVRDDTL